MNASCRMFGHRPSRHRVKRYGEVTMGRCGRCGVALIRDPSRNRWREPTPRELDAVTRPWEMPAPPADRRPAVEAARPRLDVAPIAPAHPQPEPSRVPEPSQAIVNWMPVHRIPVRQAVRTEPQRRRTW